MMKKLFFVFSIIVISITSAIYSSVGGYKDTGSKDVVKSFDVIVIGSGAGTKLVRPVANKGFKVAIIEKDKLGGTCLNKGCIPSKMLIHSAELAMKIKEAGKFNLEVEGMQIHFEQLMKRVASVIDKESEKIEPLYESNNNITFYHDKAVFIDDHTLRVGKDLIRAPKIFIATGVETSIPSIKGLEGTPYMTYKEALRNTQLPKKLLVIGGGYIAAELGYFYGALGTDLHIFARDRMLSKEDSEIREEFEKAFSKHFHIHSKTKIKEVVYEEGVFTLIYEDETGREFKEQGDALLVATGMKPLTTGIGLENTQIDLDEHGYIQVNEMLETTSKGVFSFGDCIGRHGFRHSANYEGEYLFNRLFVSHNESPIVYKPMPHAIFTYPQIASVGKTEDELKKESIEYIKGVARYENSAMGMALCSEEGFVKLLFEKSSKKLIGAHIIGEEASNMIHVLIAFMNMDATLEDLQDMIYIHPALPEVIRNAARLAK